MAVEALLDLKLGKHEQQRGTYLVSGSWTGSDCTISVAESENEVFWSTVVKLK